MSRVIDKCIDMQLARISNVKSQYSQNETHIDLGLSFYHVAGWRNVNSLLHLYLALACLQA